MVSALGVKTVQPLASRTAEAGVIDTSERITRAISLILIPLGLVTGANVPAKLLFDYVSFFSCLSFFAPSGHAKTVHVVARRCGSMRRRFSARSFARFPLVDYQIKKFSPHMRQRTSGVWILSVSA